MRNLQTAWEAIEKGDHVEAQSLVAQILRDDPRNAEAWMILGEAVSGDRQVLFLRKALQLNPDLEPAKARLEELEAAGAVDAETEAEEEKSDLPSIPPNVSLDAPTVPIAERLNANRSSPQQASAGLIDSKKAQRKKSSLGNTILLVLVALTFFIVLFFFIQSLMG